MRPKKSAEESREKESAAALPEDSSHIIITIAREYGSGGREIGLKVAQALKIPFYDRELIAMEARECGLSSDYVESTEEGLSLRDTAWNWAAQSYGAFETHLFATGNLSEADRLFQAQRQVIRQIARKGSCVIIGRCADYILKDYPGCLRIFIRSDPDQRRQRTKPSIKSLPKKQTPS